MAKQKLNKSQRKKRKFRGALSQNNLSGSFATWQEKDGIHAIMAGERPSEEKLAEMTRTYQQQIKQSPLFKDWVAKFGKKEALKLLKQCRAELK